MDRKCGEHQSNLLNAMPDSALPDYDGGSIANLAATLSLSMGARLPVAGPLRGIAPQAIGRFQNVVLLIIDGLGWHFLHTKATRSFLFQHIHQCLTSVFPSTTATAITSLATGLTPQQHAITGWFMYLRNIDSVTAILPFKSRLGQEFPDQPDYDPGHHYRFASMLGAMPRRKYVVNDARIVDSAYSLATSGDAARLPYHSLAGMMHSIVTVTRSSAESKYIYAYWPEFDAICHANGAASAEACRHFEDIDGRFEAMTQELAGSDTLILVTADHGFLDTEPGHVLYLEAHPELQRMLRLPLCGEPRAAYCYLQPGCEQAFKDYVAAHLAEMCACFSRAELLDLGLFGCGAVHPDFHDRVGDYVLLARENWVIKDTVAGEKSFAQIGVHGGLSRAEMQVPLIAIDCTTLGASAR